MSAEKLREAAKVLREVAEGATPGPWEAFRRGDPAGPFGVCSELAGDLSPDVFEGSTKPDAHYIATMHPPVALAVADWLDDIALIWERAEFMADDDGDPISFGESIDSHALAVAKAVLG